MIPGSQALPGNEGPIVFAVTPVKAAVHASSRRKSGTSLYLDSGPGFHRGKLEDRRDDGTWSI